MATTPTSPSCGCRRGPSPERPAGAVLLVLGVNNVGRNHPVIERVADGLARTGVAVLVPDSRTLLEGRLEVGEIDGVVRLSSCSRRGPRSTPERSGSSASASAARSRSWPPRDPRIAGDVRWVNAFGAFADASTYLAAVSAHAYLDDGEQVPWTPSPLAREVYLQFLLDQVVDPTTGSASTARRRRRPGRRSARAEPGLARWLRTDAARRSTTCSPRHRWTIARRRSRRCRRPAWRSSTRSHRSATSTASRRMSI